MVVEQISQVEYTEWFRNGRKIAEGLEAEADVLYARSKELKDWARQVRRALPKARRGSYGPRKSEEPAAPAPPEEASE